MLICKKQINIISLLSWVFMMTWTLVYLKFKFPSDATARFIISWRKRSTVWKVSKYGVISGQYFPVFSTNTGKYGPEITSYLDTFHAEKLWVYFQIMLRPFSWSFYQVLWHIHLNKYIIKTESQISNIVGVLTKNFRNFFIAYHYTIFTM